MCEQQVPSVRPNPVYQVEIRLDGVDLSKFPMVGDCETVGFISNLPQEANGGGVLGNILGI